jgi:hypothetical protein
MSSDGTGYRGVTNHFGEVFTGDGKCTHDGLVVTDAAVIPTALGVNPFATITALAERSVKHMADKMGVEINYDAQNGILDLFGSPAHPLPVDISIRKAQNLIKETEVAQVSGFEFSEVMCGYIHFGDNMPGDRPEDFEVAARTARGLCEAAKFFVSVKAWNTQTSKVPQNLL